MHNLTLVAGWLLILTIVSLGLSPITFAQNTTVISNQVRGEECCDTGRLDFFEQQLQTLTDLELLGHFALRWDVINSSAFLSLIERFPNQKYGLLLEITPQLAAQANVEYQAPLDNWFAAHHSMLIGYSQFERKQLIDTLMDGYQEVFNQNPVFTTAWMIDAWSLNYLQSEYGVLVHQITREQFGTDTYTLYGGPPHYPYLPSKNWALIPDSTNTQSPLIMRQTITDPVYNYGDQSNGFTSQPNDYALQPIGFEYFVHIFNQAHTQPHPVTFGLVGLENSMAEQFQTEFVKQLEYIAQWQQQAEHHRVVSVEELREIFSSPDEKISVYTGQGFQTPDERAWWITTNTYRARLRLSQGELFISDLRLYHPDFTDPYLSSPAQQAGWWVVPFTLDSSRMGSSTDVTKIETDQLQSSLFRPAQLPRLTVSQVESITTIRDGDAVVISADQQELLRFTPDEIVLKTNVEPILTGDTYPFSNLTMVSKKLDEQHQPTPLWSSIINGNNLNFTINTTDLNQARSDWPYWLFPEPSTSQFDQNTSQFVISNRYAVAGRNPARAVLIPKDEAYVPVTVTPLPTISTDQDLVQTKVFEPENTTGLIFFDASKDQPGSAEITIKYHGSETQEQFSEVTYQVFFAPDCKAELTRCLTDPRQGYWYLRSVAGDWWREWREG